MLLQQMMPQDLLSPLMTGSPAVLVVPGHDPALSVPSALLTLFSPRLATILNAVPHCTAPALILPDYDLQTVSVLLQLLTKGRTTMEESADVISCVLDLARLLGISMENLANSTAKSSTVAENHNHRRSRRISTLSKQKSPEVVSNVEGKVAVRGPRSAKAGQVAIKQERQREEDVAGFRCQVCPKTFGTPEPLGHHYCTKHFMRELESLDFGDFISNESPTGSLQCIKCDNRKFMDKSAILSHIGVAHQYINTLLEHMNIQTLPFSSVDRITPSNKVLIKHERTERGCEVCSQDFSSDPPSSLARHYCEHFSSELPQHFERFHTDKTCRICSKSFETQGRLMFHIGVKHWKVNSILSSKNMTRLKSDQKRKGMKKKSSSGAGDGDVEKAPVQSSQTAEDQSKLDARTCFVCGKYMEAMGNLKTHICSHFTNELKETCAEFISVDGNTCLICNSNRPNRPQLLAHLGLVHGKLDQILVARGHPALTRHRDLPVQQAATATAAPRVKDGRSRGRLNGDIKEVRQCEICSKGSFFNIDG